ncbi:hypothetical protein OUZ56_021622 [Daphnia magna]|uniref:Uncharacterized protein n=1 Tax=Daphnia magna TaxID=35525 RepID=A0ABR0AU09_9CRUS|nr:hypothetical protein OUZ56_021622 [Daphnia magna]
MDVLGESSKSCFAHVESWFCMKVGQRSKAITMNMLDVNLATKNEKDALGESSKRKVKSCKIKPITVTRQAQPKNKPLGVNFHMLTSKSSFSVVTFRFLVQSKSLNSYENWLLPLLPTGKDIAFERIKSYIRLVSRRLILDFSTNNSYGTQISRLAEPPYVSAVPPDNSECRTRLDVLA